MKICLLNWKEIRRDLVAEIRSFVRRPLVCERRWLKPFYSCYHPLRDSSTFLQIHFESDLNPPEVLRHCACVVKTIFQKSTDVWKFNLLWKKSFSEKRLAFSRRGSRFMRRLKQNEESCSHSLCDYYTLRNYSRFTTRTHQQKETSDWERGETRTNPVQQKNRDTGAGKHLNEFIKDVFFIVRWNTLVTVCN